MKHIHKEYERAFLLEPTKLTRILDKIHARLQEHEPTTRRDSFEVFLSGNRREEMTELDAVLALENSRKQKIERMIITCCAGRKVATRLEHEIQIDFGAKKSSSTSNKKVVAVSIHSDATGWASSTLSELEEQLERTRLNYMQPILTLCGILILALIVLAFQFIAIDPRFRTTDDVLREMWLHDADLDRVDQILSQNRTITDEEMREIKTMQLRSIRQDQRRMQEPRKGMTQQIVLIAVPLVVIIVCGFILLATCYPEAVFLWGDEVERYANMQNRRKNLWGIIIGVAFIGLLSKFFAAGVISWFNP